MSVSVPAYPEYTNVGKAILIADQIQSLRYAQRELVAAFARLELDGGPKAAKEHPLFLALDKEINELHSEMTLLI